MTLGKFQSKCPKFKSPPTITTDLKFGLMPLRDLFWRGREVLYSGLVSYQNKVIDIIKFEKHFLNSTTDTQS